MNDEEHESSVLFRRKPATTEDNRKSPNGQVCHSGQFLKYVSAEIVTFCFVFVFYYYPILHSTVLLPMVCDKSAPKYDGLLQSLGLLQSNSHHRAVW